MKFRSLFIILFLSVALTGCGLFQSNTVTTEEEAAQSLDYAAGGLQFDVRLNGVTVRVDQIEQDSAADVRPGYTYIVLHESLYNESENPIIPGGFVLVDGEGNRYAVAEPPATMASRVIPLPLAINKGDSLTGHQVFLVPDPALSANLKLRWESETHESRIEVFLGDL
ncbi:MAG: hypothetical protein GY943_24010 [Chloroflexi bacterium]|nr:hypothetical protein [Chloroflexota bacterium]